MRTNPLYPTKPTKSASNFSWRFVRPIGRKRPFTIAIRLSLIEKNLINARRGNLSIADFLRQSAMGHDPIKREIVRRIVPPKVEPELSRQLNFIGNNLNQLTKLAHIKNNNNDLSALAIITELATIRQSIDDIKNHYTYKGGAE